MLISCGMIQEELAPILVDIELNDWDRQMNLKRVVAYEEESILRSDTIYIMPEELSSQAYIENLRVENGTAVILWNPLNLQELTKSASWYVPDTQLAGFPRVMNLITSVFEKYQEYDRALLEMAYSGKNLQHMVAFATRIFQNELTIRNADYQIIAQSYLELQEMKNSGMPQPDEKGIYDFNVIGQLESDPVYQSIAPGEKTADRVGFYHSELLLTDSYFIDVHSRGRFLYRLRLSNSCRPFRNFDSALLEHFAGLVKEKINQTDFMVGQSPPAESILKGLLGKTYSCSEDDQEVLMQELQWQIRANYMCICLTLSRSSENLKKRSYYGKIMGQKFHGLYFLEYDEQLVAVMNLDVAYAGDIANFNREMVDFLRDENMRAGYSLKFKDLMLLQYYYHQAKVALDMGEKYQPQMWVHRFQDHIYDSIGYHVKNDFGGALACDTGLQEVHTYDIEKNTELLHTLHIYLDCRQNAVQTSKLLHIHRATLNYRLQRIVELTALNLNDAEHMLLVHLLVSLYEKGFT